MYINTFAVAAEQFEERSITNSIHLPIVRASGMDTLALGLPYVRTEVKAKCKSRDAKIT
jgi:hypothetical protein